jgi:hypothetical protein
MHDRTVHSHKDRLFASVDFVAFKLSYSIPGAQTYSVYLKRISCSVLLRPSLLRYRLQKRLHNSIIVLYFILLYNHCELR